MRAIVLGSAAGGGFPQWNSNAAACRRARAGDPAAASRTQASLAVMVGDGAWVLLNAAPDLRQQISQTPDLHPAGSLRSSPIAGVILTGGDVDAVAGLLTLRERQAFAVHATAETHAVLDANPIFEVLDRGIVARPIETLGTPFRVALPGGGHGTPTFELFAVPGKVPLFLETPGDAPAVETTGQTVGVAIACGRHRIFYIPGCAAMTPELAERLRGADMVLFDGTLWDDDEMIRAGLGPKTGQRMGHMSVSGAVGVLAAFAALPVGRRILIHINNSNPILLADTPERAAVAEAGWEVAFDGMELVL